MWSVVISGGQPNQRLSHWILSCGDLQLAPARLVGSVADGQQLRQLGEVSAPQEQEQRQALTALSVARITRSSLYVVTSAAGLPERDGRHDSKTD